MRIVFQTYQGCKIQVRSSRFFFEYQVLETIRRLALSIPLQLFHSTPRFSVDLERLVLNSTRHEEPHHRSNILGRWLSTSQCSVANNMQRKHSGKYISNRIGTSGDGGRSDTPSSNFDCQFLVHPHRDRINSWYGTWFGYLQHASRDLWTSKHDAVLAYL